MCGECVTCAVSALKKAASTQGFLRLVDPECGG
jgi:hypothetical protein